MAEYIDLGLVPKVKSVADGNSVYVEAGGSVARVELTDFVNRMAGDSAEAMETLRAVKEALDGGDDDATVAMLNKIGANTSAIEALQEKDGQFTVKGVYLNKAGNTAQSAGSASVTPFMPLNRTEPIVLVNVTARGAVVGVAFYDCTKAFISVPDEAVDLVGANVTIPVDSFPANACFFRVCTEIDGSSFTNGPTREAREGAVVDAVVSAKEALFINEFNLLAGPYGGYDPKNAPDAQRPYKLNELWLTFAEAMESKIYMTKITSQDKSHFACHTSARTLLIYFEGNSLPSTFVHGAYANTSVVNIRLASSIKDQHVRFSDATEAFAVCNQLKTVYGVLDLSVYQKSNVKLFRSAVKLEDIQILGLKNNADFVDCPLLSLASFQYLIANAANTAAITITVHADVYAKLSDTANAEWHKVMTDAAAKNISFATA